MLECVSVSVCTLRPVTTHRLRKLANCIRLSLNASPRARLCFSTCFHSFLHPCFYLTHLLEPFFWCSAAAVCAARMPSLNWCRRLSLSEEEEDGVNHVSQKCVTKKKKLPALAPSHPLSLKFLLLVQFHFPQMHLYLICSSYLSGDARLVRKVVNLPATIFWT